MPPVKTYSVKVEGFPAALYSARTPGKARARCWASYCSFRDVSFRDFLKISTCRRVPNPPGVGERIIVSGKPAIRCIQDHTQYVNFMWVDGDVVLCSHPADVSYDAKNLEPIS